MATSSVDRGRLQRTPRPVLRRRHVFRHVSMGTARASCKAAFVGLPSSCAALTVGQLESCVTDTYGQTCDTDGPQRAVL